MIHHFLLAVAGIAICTAGMVSAHADDAVLVFGGSSGAGLETVRLLRGRGRAVTVFVRPTSDRSGLDPLDVQYAVGDALNEEDVRGAFASGSFSAIVSSLGGRAGEPLPYYPGNRNINSAAKAAGVTRVIQLSGSSVGRAPDKKPAPDDFVANIQYEKKRAEDDLIASGLEYTILRPGGLLDGPPTGKADLYPPDSPAGAIVRSDLAALVVRVLDDDSTTGRIYDTVDYTLEFERPRPEDINRRMRGMSVRPE